MKISVIGTGYVGLVVSVCFAESGNDVIGADIDSKKVDKLNKGEVTIVERGLSDILQRNIEGGRLRFTTDITHAIQSSKVIFLAVGTPSGKDSEADLSTVIKIAQQIGTEMNEDKIIVTKSTVPVGTGDMIRKEIEARTEYTAHICSNPEFLKEGDAVRDFQAPNRVVLGTDSEYAKEVLCCLYEPFMRIGRKPIIMDVRSAEITKYACNAMLAVRISLMNMVAQLCDKTGADADMVRHGVGSDKRIGRRFLYPGIGYGGSCFPKDMRALIHTLRKYEVDSTMLESADSVNKLQKQIPLEYIYENLGSDLRGCKVAVWGLAFKPNTDDMREAPSIVTIRAARSRSTCFSA